MSENSPNLFTLNATNAFTHVHLGTCWLWRAKLLLPEQEEEPPIDFYRGSTTRNSALRNHSDWQEN
jgi:hypothetical protein